MGARQAPTTSWSGSSPTVLWERPPAVGTPQAAEAPAPAIPTPVTAQMHQIYTASAVVPDSSRWTSVMLPSQASRSSPRPWASRRLDLELLLVCRALVTEAPHE